jgi:hypothetical protein
MNDEQNVDNITEVKVDPKIEDIVEINRLEPPECGFYLAKGGFIGLKVGDEDKGRVNLLKMRPFTDEDGYVSVRDMDMKEIGIVYAIADFPEDEQKLMRDELAMRYFTPEVLEVTEIKEEYGYTFIWADTSAGKREFVMRDLSNNIIFLSPTKALLVDTDGNRYLVPELRKLNDKAMRVIGVWA